MTNEEAWKAFKSQCAIVYNSRYTGTLILYDRIVQYIYTIESDGTNRISVVLTEKNDRSRLVALTSNIEVYDPKKPLDNIHYFVKK